VLNSYAGRLLDQHAFVQKIRGKASVLREVVPPGRLGFATRSDATRRHKRVPDASKSFANRCNRSDKAGNVTSPVPRGRTPYHKPLCQRAPTPQDYGPPLQDLPARGTSRATPWPRTGSDAGGKGFKGIKTPLAAPLVRPSSTPSPPQTAPPGPDRWEILGTTPVNCVHEERAARSFLFS
jgi:hypothetical protein